MTAPEQQAQWPVADFDPVRRLHVIAQTAPGAASVGETVFDLPLEQVWAVAQDLECTMPLWIPDIRTVRLSGPPDPHGRLTARIHGHTRLRATFRIELRPGWCLMQSRFVLGGMAARSEPDGTTRFALLGGLSLPGARHITPLLRPFTGSPLERFAKLLA